MGLTGAPEADTTEKIILLNMTYGGRSHGKPNVETDTELYCR